MFWNAISFNQTVDLVAVKSMMGFDFCIDVPQNVLLPNAKKELPVSDWISQHANVAFNKSQMARTFWKANDVYVFNRLSNHMTLILGGMCGNFRHA